MKEVDRRIKASAIEMDEIEAKIQESEERIMAKVKAVENTTVAIHDSAKRTKKKAMMVQEEQFASFGNEKAEVHQFEVEETQVTST